MTCPQGHRWRDAKGRCVLCKDISVEPDQAWRNFAYTFKPGVRKEIYSKRQFERECQTYGLRPVAKDDLVKRGLPYHPDPMGVDLPKETVASVIQEVQRSATPDRVNRHWHQQQQRRMHVP